MGESFKEKHIIEVNTLIQLIEILEFQFNLNSNKDYLNENLMKKISILKIMLILMIY